MISNLGALVKECKKHLREYLEEKKIRTTGKLFQCPNKVEHSNQDAKPSANFFPDDRSWHCFSCEYKARLGDIFDAVHLLEHKDIKGENFVVVIKYLCDKYKIPYKETTTEEEQFLKSVSTYLTEVVSSAHINLKNSKNPNLKKLLEEKKWTASVDAFKLGYFDKPYTTTVDKDILSYLNLNPKDLIDRLIIPIKDAKGSIVGITTRSLEVDTKTSTARYMHFISYSLNKLMFNIDKVDPTKEVIVVEGPSSVITLNSFGITNVVATYGNYMHLNQYSVMVKKGIKKVLFLYDGDVGGKEGLRNSLEALCRGDLKARVGFLQDDLDPGDYVVQNKNLIKVPTLDLYTYLVDSYTANTDDKPIEKCLMTYINAIKDTVRQEKLVNELSKKLKINKSTILDLLGIYKQGSNVGIKEVLKEREALVQTLNEFEKWSWNRGTLLGLKSFESFDKKLDGLQNGLILLGGKPNIGKSAVLITTATKIIQRNDNVHLLYFTIDDSIFVTLSRFIANLSKLPINIVSNPNYRITKADIPDHVKQDYIERREKAMGFLRQHSSIFSLKDSSEGSTIEMIKEKVRMVSALTEGKQLVVFIDNLHNLRSSKYVSDRHLYSLISNELNTIANVYKCPVIASTHITKESIKNKQYDGNAIKETVEFFYDAKLILFIDADDEALEGTRDDLEVKIIVSKNKMSAYKGYIPMTFYRSLSKVVELTGKETEDNLFK